MSYINDINSAGELVRLDHQAGLVGHATGLLPLQLEHEDFMSILDVGCGSGRWALDMAFARRDAEVVGIDISRDLVEYANARARSQGLDNVSFEVKDIFEKVLPSAEGSFDLINLRFAVGWVQGYEHWLLLLTRLSTLLKSGGYMIVTEGEGIYTTSLALERLHEIFCTALFRTGYGTSISPRFMGVAAQLGDLLLKSGLKNVRSEANVLDYSHYNHEANVQWRMSFHLLISESAAFLLNSGVTTPEELAELDAGIAIDMFREGFCGMGPLFTFYAQK